MDDAARKNNVRTRIINTYWPTVRASSGVSYSQQLEALTIMIIQNDSKIQLWIDPNTEISKWIHQVEHIILMGEWNSEASEVNT